MDSPEISGSASGVEAALASLDAARVPRRIALRDPTVWREDPTGISDRLGWLDVIGWMRPRISAIRSFARGLIRDGVRDVVLLGMGGSSLAPEVFRRTFGPAPGHPDLHVLDTTSPRRIRRVTGRIDPESFHALVASKSGTTIEVQALLAHFREVAGGDGSRFTAVTDPGTVLEKKAAEDGYCECFLNDPEIGGRYSALSCFGLVPAAVLGMDLDGLLDRAAVLAARCETEGAADNPGCTLGAAMGCAARRGRDKLTLVASPEIGSFGLWIEQLVAESTGKDGVGIVPVAGEPAAAVECTGEDRFVVVLRLEGGDNAGVDARETALREAGVPVRRIDVPDRLSIGAEMFRWEYATAVAGHMLGIQPFDQPDVQSTKTATAKILDTLESGGRLPDEPAGDGAALLDEVRPGDYVAVMVYGDPDVGLESAIADLRRALLETRGVATTLGIGPRFLHSTGQLHKGGADSGVFFQLLLDEGALSIPGRSFGFHQLIAAQAGGDLSALRAAGRRVVRLDRAEPVATVRALARHARSS